MRKKRLPLIPLRLSRHRRRSVLVCQRSFPDALGPRMCLGFSLLPLPFQYLCSFNTLLCLYFALPLLYSHLHHSWYNGGVGDDQVNDSHFPLCTLLIWTTRVVHRWMESNGEWHEKRRIEHYRPDWSNHFPAPRLHSTDINTTNFCSRGHQLQLRRLDLW